MPDDQAVFLLQAIKTFGVAPSARRGVVDWLLNGLRSAGARIVAAPKINRAPFVIVIELPWTGERLGIVAYLFTSTSRITRNRPEDEARFQIKYGSKQESNLHDLFDDPYGLWTTLMCGIDLENGLAVSVDPLVHSPTRFFISVEYKHHYMEIIARDGWNAWDRDRNAWSDRWGAIAREESAATETLVGARQDRVLDLVLFERAARGLAPAYRHLLADEWLQRRAQPPANLTEHELVKMLGLQPEDILDMITTAPRLGMAVRGWTAQRHLEKHLGGLAAVAAAQPIERDGEPDIEVALASGKTIRIECKNTLRGTVRGLPKVDFQRTRAPQGNPCGRYYAAAEFDVLAACLHPITKSWEFRFKVTRAMEPHPRCDGRLNHNVLVDGSWSPDLADALAAL